MLSNVGAGVGAAAGFVCGLAGAGRFWAMDGEVSAVKISSKVASRARAFMGARSTKSGSLSMNSLGQTFPNLVFPVGPNQLADEGVGVGVGGSHFG